MSFAAAPSRPCLLLAVLLGSCTAVVAAAPAQTPAGDAAVVLYHIRPGDTLIGLARRMLTQPGLWQQLGSLNHVRYERRLPPDGVLKIPIEWLRWTPRASNVRVVSGSVIGNGRALAAGDTLPEGAQVVAERGGSATLGLPDGSELTLTPGTRLTLQHARSAIGTDAPDVQLDLSEGHVEVGARKHHDVGRFEIRTPVASTAVRGTRFRSHFNDQDFSATTETLEGVVGVANAAATQAVTAGYGTRAERGQPPVAPVQLLPAPDLSALPDVSSHETVTLGFPPVEHARAYRIQVSEDEKFSTLARDLRATQPQATLGQLPDGTYWLRARAIDPLGIEGLDGLRTFRQQAVPEPPQGAAPRDQEDLTAPVTHFSWSNTGAKYRFQLAHDATFASPVKDIADLAGTEVTVTDLAPGRYAWRVAAVNSAGAAGPWGPARGFTERPAPPAADVTVDARTRRLEARCAAPPDYQCALEVSPEAGFGDLRVEQQISGAATQLPPLRPGWYFARMHWVDSHGYVGPAGPTRKFFAPPPRWVWLLIPGAAAAAALL